MLWHVNALQDGSVTASAWVEEPPKAEAHDDPSALQGTA